VLLLSILASFSAIAVLSVKDTFTDNQVSFIENLKSKTVFIEWKQYTGSGVIIGDNYIITCAHIFKDQNIEFSPIKITTYSHLVCEAAILHKSEEDDLTILQTTNPLIFDNSITKSKFNTSLLDTGQKVFHIGNWYGPNFPNSYSEGSVSNPKVKLIDQTRDNIFVSLNVYPGSSGGGVFNEKGECIGIVQMIMNNGGSLVIPARHIKAWAAYIDFNWPN
jgi:S1-C subfamily serine protease